MSFPHRNGWNPRHVPPRMSGCPPNNYRNRQNFGNSNYGQWSNFNYSYYGPWQTKQTTPTGNMPTKNSWGGNSTNSWRNNWSMPLYPQSRYNNVSNVNNNSQYYATNIPVQIGNIRKANQYKWPPLQRANQSHKAVPSEDIVSAKQAVSSEVLDPNPVVVENNNETGANNENINETGTSNKNDEISMQNDRDPQRMGFNSDMDIASDEESATIWTNKQISVSGNTANENGQTESQVFTQNKNLNTPNSEIADNGGLNDTSASATMNNETLISDSLNKLVTNISSSQIDVDVKKIILEKSSINVVTNKSFLNSIEKKTDPMEMELQTTKLKPEENVSKSRNSDSPVLKLSRQLYVPLNKMSMFNIPASNSVAVTETKISDIVANKTVETKSNRKIPDNNNSLTDKHLQTTSDNARVLCGEEENSQFRKIKLNWLNKSENSKVFTTHSAFDEATKFKETGQLSVKGNDNRPKKSDSRPKGTHGSSTTESDKLQTDTKSLRTKESINKPMKTIPVSTKESKRKLPKFKECSNEKEMRSSSSSLPKRSKKTIEIEENSNKTKEKIKEHKTYVEKKSSDRSSVSRTETVRPRETHCNDKEIKNKDKSSIYQDKLVNKKRHEKLEANLRMNVNSKKVQHESRKSLFEKSKSLSIQSDKSLSVIREEETITEEQKSSSDQILVNTNSVKDHQNQHEQDNKNELDITKSMPILKRRNTIVLSELLPKSTDVDEFCRTRKIRRNSHGSFTDFDFTPPSNVTPHLNVTSRSKVTHHSNVTLPTNVFSKFVNDIQITGNQTFTQNLHCNKEASKSSPVSDDANKSNSECKRQKLIEVFGSDCDSVTSASECWAPPEVAKDDSAKDSQKKKRKKKNNQMENAKNGKDTVQLDSTEKELLVQLDNSGEESVQWDGTGQEPVELDGAGKNFAQWDSELRRIAQFDGFATNVTKRKGKSLKKKTILPNDSKEQNSIAKPSKLVGLSSALDNVKKTVLFTSEPLKEKKNDVKVYKKVTARITSVKKYLPSTTRITSKQKNEPHLPKATTPEKQENGVVFTSEPLEEKNKDRKVHKKKTARISSVHKHLPKTTRITSTEKNAPQLSKETSITPRKQKSAVPHLLSKSTLVTSTKKKNGTSHLPKTTSITPKPKNVKPHLSKANRITSTKKRVVPHSSSKETDAPHLSKQTRVTPEPKKGVPDLSTKEVEITILPQEALMDVPHLHKETRITPTPKEIEPHLPKEFPAVILPQGALTSKETQITPTLTNNVPHLSQETQITPTLKTVEPHLPRVILPQGALMPKETQITPIQTNNVPHLSQETQITPTSKTVEPHLPRVILPQGALMPQETQITPTQTNNVPHLSQETQITPTSKTVVPHLPRVILTQELVMDIVSEDIFKLVDTFDTPNLSQTAEMHIVPEYCDRPEFHVAVIDNSNQTFKTETIKNSCGLIGIVKGPNASSEAVSSLNSKHLNMPSKLCFHKPYIQSCQIINIHDSDSDSEPKVETSADHSNLVPDKKLNAKGNLKNKKPYSAEPTETIEISDEDEPLPAAIDEEDLREALIRVSSTFSRKKTKVFDTVPSTKTHLNEARLKTDLQSFEKMEVSCTVPSIETNLNEACLKTDLQLCEKMEVFGTVPSTETNLNETLLKSSDLQCEMMEVFDTVPSIETNIKETHLNSSDLQSCEVMEVFDTVPSIETNLKQTHLKSSDLQSCEVIEIFDIDLDAESMVPTFTERENLVPETLPKTKADQKEVKMEIDKNVEHQLKSETKANATRTKEETKDTQQIEVNVKSKLLLGPNDIELMVSIAQLLSLMKQENQLEAQHAHKFNFIEALAEVSSRMWKNQASLNKHQFAPEFGSEMPSTLTEDTSIAPSSPSVVSEVPTLNHSLSSNLQSCTVSSVPRLKAISGLDFGNSSDYETPIRPSESHSENSCSLPSSGNLTGPENSSNYESPIRPAESHSENSCKLSSSGNSTGPENSSNYESPIRPAESHSENLCLLSSSGKVTGPDVPNNTPVLSKESLASSDQSPVLLTLHQLKVLKSLLSTQLEIWQNSSSLQRMIQYTEEYLTAHREVKILCEELFIAESRIPFEIAQSISEVSSTEQSQNVPELFPGGVPSVKSTQASDRLPSVPTNQFFADPLNPPSQTAKSPKIVEALPTHVPSNHFLNEIPSEETPLNLTISVPRPVPTSSEDLHLRELRRTNNVVPNECLQRDLVMPNSREISVLTNRFPTPDEVPLFTNTLPLLESPLRMSPQAIALNLHTQTARDISTVATNNVISNNEHYERISPCTNTLPLLESQLRTSPQEIALNLHTQTARDISTVATNNVISNNEHYERISPCSDHQINNVLLTTRSKAIRHQPDLISKTSNERAGYSQGSRVVPTRTVATVNVVEFSKLFIRKLWAMMRANYIVNNNCRVPSNLWNFEEITRELRTPINGEEVMMLRNISVDLYKFLKEQNGISFDFMQFCAVVRSEMHFLHVENIFCIQIVDILWRIISNWRVLETESVQWFYELVQHYVKIMPAGNFPRMECMLTILSVSSHQQVQNMYTNIGQPATTVRAPNKSNSIPSAQFRPDMRQPKAATAVSASSNKSNNPIQPPQFAPYILNGVLNNQPINRAVNDNGSSSMVFNGSVNLPTESYAFSNEVNNSRALNGSIAYEQVNHLEALQKISDRCRQTIPFKAPTTSINQGSLWRPSSRMEDQVDYAVPPTLTATSCAQQNSSMENVSGAIKSKKRPRKSSATQNKSSWNQPLPVQRLQVHRVETPLDHPTMRQRESSSYKNTKRQKLDSDMPVLNNLVPSTMEAKRNIMQLFYPNQLVQPIASSASGTPLNSSSSYQNGTPLPAVANLGKTNSNNGVQNVSLNNSVPYASLNKSVPNAKTAPSRKNNIAQRTETLVNTMQKEKLIRSIAPAPIALDMPLIDIELPNVNSIPTPPPETVQIASNNTTTNDQVLKDLLGHSNQAVQDTEETYDQALHDIGQALEDLSEKGDLIIDFECEDDNICRSSTDVLPPKSSVDSGFSSPHHRMNDLFEPAANNKLCICSELACMVCLCRIAIYCSTECQQEDWPNHKDVCLKHRAMSET